MKRFSAVVMACGMLIGCATEGEENEPCMLQQNVICEGDSCYCLEDVGKRNPMERVIAEEVCPPCESPGPLRVELDAGTGMYDDFGGIDHFSGDDDWGTEVRRDEGWE